MNIVFTIQHPAHVHFFKHAIKELKKNHDIRTFVRDKEIIRELLETYEIDYTVLSTLENSSFGTFYIQLKYEYKLWKNTKESPPNLFCAIGGTAASHISKFFDSKSIIFTDTEHATLQNNITFPFADRICTPDCYKEDIGPKQVRYPGYHELAYLHPNRFTPDLSVLDYIDADVDDKIVIIRLSAWDAAHDLGQKGFGDIVDAVYKLESKGAQVIITSEDDYPEEIKHCISSVPVYKMHDLMYYASLYIGEGGTMASESAVLGTPAIFISTLRLGYLEELENKYGLVFNFSGKHRQKNALKKSLSILENYDDKKWKRKREKMLEKKIDTTKFILKEIKKFGENSF